MDDEAIRNAFYDLMESCRDWARRYSDNKPLTLLEHPDTRISIGDYETLTHICKRFDILTEPVYGRYLVLNAILSTFIYQHFVPLFFLEDKAPVDCLLKLIGQKGRENVPHWATVTLAMLGDNPDGSPSEDFDNMKANAYDRAIGAFLGTMDRILWKCPVEFAQEKCKAELRNIFSSAGEFALGILKKGLFVDCLTSSSEELMGNDFQLNSDLMKPHGSMQLGEIGERLDGKQITLVVEPAIVGCGIDYTGKKVKRVWSKAVVWVENWKKLCEVPPPPENPTRTFIEDVSPGVDGGATIVPVANHQDSSRDNAGIGATERIDSPGNESARPPISEADDGNHNELQMKGVEGSEGSEDNGRRSEENCGSGSHKGPRDEPKFSPTMRSEGGNHVNTPTTEAGRAEDRQVMPHGESSNTNTDEQTSVDGSKRGNSSSQMVPETEAGQPHHAGSEVASHCSDVGMASAEDLQSAARWEQDLTTSNSHDISHAPKKRESTPDWSLTAQEESPFLFPPRRLEHIE
ncbi:hypothetical protein AJ80_02135 [Polytolypa hystricis UAMH7299]|uniref:Uncharacterized protein n=1 Tax=Polytolypa hystricis (strain UAMH7299) TaxID=1447883 RepID=A0A2B7YQD6_POLH7|nr:hypothetical protein AJ80_02135 [Polytolypa hystricis UAMH7299]